MSQKRKRHTAHTKDQHSDLLVFGYSSRIFDNESLAHKVEEGHFLIPWQSNTEYNHIKFDRYDARHLLDCLDTLMTQHNDEQHHESQKEEEEDQDRYEELDSDEEELFDLESMEAREQYVEEKRKRRNMTRQGKLFKFDYNEEEEKRAGTSTIADRTEEIRLVAQRYDIPLSSTIQIPSNKSESVTHDLIVNTAQTVLEHASTKQQTVNVCEIQFQVRHCQEPQYDFLNRQHSLYPFYQHVLQYYQRNPPPTDGKPKHIKATNPSMAGLVNYGSEDETSEEDEEDEDDKRKLEIPPVEMRQIIEKTAGSVAKIGKDLEGKIRHLRKNDQKFQFLQPNHPHHAYYQSKLLEYRRQQL